MMCTFQPPKVNQSLPPFAQPQALTELVFDELTLFESVSEQYQQLGMHIQGAIAIHPSNSAFHPLVDAIALMSEAGNTPIEITFDRSIRRIVAVVNGARQIRITGFDRYSNILAHDRTATRLSHIPDESLKGGEAIVTFPWRTLTIETEGLSRVVFSSDAPFLLQSLSYC